ncbi:uncharacterized protein [Haliotis asinina]|uniref:uncharacterized protein n=1 Tax=Haliotis asinina TaxID=109174 RepID=UPI0035326923
MYVKPCSPPRPMNVAVLFLCLLQSRSVWGLIMPTTKPNAAADLASLSNLVTQLQQTVTALQASNTHAAADITSLKKQVASLKLASKTVSFHVWRPSGDARTSNAEYAPLTFNRMDINAGSGYNITAGTFTAPVSGTYLFYLEVDVFKKNADMFIFMKKSGGVFKSAGFQEAGVAAVAVRHLDKGEEVGVVPEQSSYYYTTPAQIFGGVLLSAD